MDDGEKRIALLIDADNAPASKIDVILAEVARHGAANVRRAYGNWKSPNLKPWEATLHAYAIRPIQQFAYSSGKNASDMAMVIDAMDLLYARSVDAFAIVSSDADFTPLVMRILTDGVKVYGFGERRRPNPSSTPVRSSPTSKGWCNRRPSPMNRCSRPATRRSCAATPASFRCCAMPWTQRTATMAGRTWGRWATRSATRRRSTHATTVTGS